MSSQNSKNALPADQPDLPGPMPAFESWVTLLTNIAFALATLCVLIDLLLLGASVTARYIIGKPLIWGDEIVALSLTTITMLAAPKVLLDHGHIEVDILTDHARGTMALIARCWSSLAVLAVACLLMFNGWTTAMFSRMIGLLTEGYLELPLWMFQLLLPLGGALLMPVAFLQLYQTFRCWRAARRSVCEGDDDTNKRL